MDLWNMERSTAWEGKTAAPFSVMNTGAGWNYAADFFGWEKFILGWIGDEDVTCLNLSTFNIEIAISKLSSSSGTKLLVIPISSTQLVAIEHRSLGNIDYGIIKNGALVYRVDLTKRNFELPIQLYPSESSKREPLSPSLPDWKRYQLAPIGDLEFVDIGQFRIANLGGNEDKIIWISQEPTGEIEKKLVELKASQLAEQRRIEAEAKAKSELETKSNSVAKTKKKSTEIKTIKCKKGKVTKRVTAASPKCPKGYIKIK
jgi:hypothetical protein